MQTVARAPGDRENVQLRTFVIGSNILRPKPLGSFAVTAIDEKIPVELGRVVWQRSLRKNDASLGPQEFECVLVNQLIRVSTILYPAYRKAVAEAQHLA